MSSEVAFIYWHILFHQWSGGNHLKGIRSSGEPLKGSQSSGHRWKTNQAVLFLALARNRLKVFRRFEDERNEV